MQVFEPPLQRRRRAALARRGRVLLFAVALLGALVALALRRAPPAGSPIRLDLEIRPQYLEQIERQRAEALRFRNFLFASDADYVPATLRVAGRRYRVALRLKGDLHDHYEGARWSMRVNVKRGERVFGMSRFKLHVPSTRNYQFELHFFDFLREQGVLAPRAFFVDVAINGVRRGTMELEEHFAKELLESQQRRDSVILKWDDGDFFRAARWLPRWDTDFSNWRAAPIEVFQPGRVAASPELSTQRRLAGSALQGVMEGVLSPSQVFDVDLWARILASCEIWGADHALSWRNIRLYYNPLTGLIEPVAYDADPLPWKAPVEKAQCQGKRRGFPTALLEDAVLRDAFLARLAELTARVRALPELERIMAREREYQTALRGEAPERAYLDPLAFQGRLAVLAGVDAGSYPAFARWLRVKRTRYRDGDRYPALLRARVVPGEAGRPGELDLLNLLNHRVVVRGLRHADPERERASPLADALGRPLPLTLAPTVFPKIPSRVRLPLPPADGAPLEVVGEASLANGSTRYAFRSRPGFPARRTPIVPVATLEEALARHPFLELDPDAERRLRVPTGVHRVSGWLVLPSGWELRLDPGTTLRFEAGAGLLARGPLRFAGTPQRPVVLEGVAAGATAQPRFAGIAALESARGHVLRDVVVGRTAGVAIGDWSTSGGVVLRGAPVSMERVALRGSDAEDALNLVRSSFTLRDVAIRDAASDGIDADFCRGSIRGGDLAVLGGDGIDVSGSRIEVDAVRLREIGDKAFSVGEASRVRIRGALVQSSASGAVSKDGSHLEISDSRLRDIRGAALAAFQKKPEYGPATLVAHRVEVADAGRDAVAQHGSRLLRDGRRVATEALDVEALYRDVGVAVDTDPGAAADGRARAP